MAAPLPIPAARHAADDFRASIQPHHLVYFLCNVGDGDSQVILLPEDTAGRRRIVVVDVATTGKVPPLIGELETVGLLAPAQPDPNGSPDGSIALVVATHPHSDHIGGMSELLATQVDRIAEFWDPGYFHTTQGYHQMMAAVEANPPLAYAQPTAGYRRWIGPALVTVLSPAVWLRNRFDTYGTQINDSSISLRVEFPAARVIQRGDGRELVYAQNTMALILGADAQPHSRSNVLTDFPELHPSGSAAAKAIKAATGSDQLRARVLKVSHHGSKNGVNLELVTRINPALTLISNAVPSTHGFPHGVAQELIREAVEAQASSPNAVRSLDCDLGIFYTSDRDDNGALLGSMAVVMGRGRATLWRFGDREDQAIDLSTARRWSG